MKYFFASLLSTFLAPINLQAGSVEKAQSICSIVDGYIQGSYHYFDCLNHIEKIDPGLDLNATIDFVCSAVDTFYDLGTVDKKRCYRDAKARLSPEPLACRPEHYLFGDKNEFPAPFSPKVLSEYRSLAKTWDEAYRAKVEYANNGLIFDLQRSVQGCLGQAYATSLDGPHPLKDALKECVFTNINAYSGPAISAENQEILAEEFVQTNWVKYRFRKLINASLQNDPITAFNSSCVLEVRSPGLQGYTFYMAGYTMD